MVKEENGPPVPELARRMTQTSCHLDPARAMVPVLQRMPADGIPPGDILDDSGYAHRVPGNWAVPLRAAGAQLIQDLHPDDRGPRGTHAGAIISNGNLYCPMTPRPLLSLGPLARDATPGQTTACDQQTAETARYKPGKITTTDADGYHRVMCPAVMGKLRCPLRPPSMSLTRQRPEILTPPAHPPACCTQQTITIPPEVNAKTAQKHDYPSQAHRYSYARRSAAERTFSTAKNPASNDISRGWCRLHWPRSRSSPAACSSSVTCASWPPSTPARPRTLTGPPTASRPKPAAGAAKHSPASPRRHNRQTAPRAQHPATPAPPRLALGDPAGCQPRHLRPRNNSHPSQKTLAEPATARAATGRRLSDPNPKIGPAPGTRQHPAQRSGAGWE